MNFVAAIAAVLLGLGFAGFGVFWIGFQTIPVAFPSPRRPSGPRTAGAVPRDLPAPVRSFLDRSLGDPPRTAGTAAVLGRGRWRLHGLLVPMRFRAWYEPGRSYRRTVEVTWFGRTVLRIQERWSRGRGWRKRVGWGTEGSGGTEEETGPETDLDGLRALWTEAFWTPSALTEARWRLDGERCILGAAALEARFENRRGRPETLESVDGPPWQAHFYDWKTFDGFEVPTAVRVHRGSSTWPECVFVVEDVVYDVPYEAVFSPPGETGAESDEASKAASAIDGRRHRWRPTGRSRDPGAGLQEPRTPATAPSFQELGEEDDEAPIAPRVPGRPDPGRRRTSLLDE